MRKRGWGPRAPERLCKRVPQEAKPLIALNIFIQMVDMKRLSQWAKAFKCLVVMAHVFDQAAFALN